MANLLRQAGSPAKRFFQSEAFWGYLFIAPIVLGVYFFSIGPIIFSFGMSLTTWDNLSEPIFIGINNFRKLFADAEVRRELINTFYFAIGTVPIGLVLSIFLANALNKKIPAKGLFRTIYYLPVVTMPIAVGMVWRWLLNSDYGLLNSLLAKISIKGPMWLGDARFIMPAIIMVSIWSQLGYNMIILLAGLQGISDSFYEVADIEGASEFVKFRKITLPLLSPTIFFLSTMMIINAFKAFDLIYVFAGGAEHSAGPMLTATRTMVYGIYEKGFSFMYMGYASAEAVVLFFIILFFTVLQFSFQKRWVHYD